MSAESIEFEPEPEQSFETLPPPIRKREKSGPRELPHSLEAEEYLLSCCLLDGADVIARCIEFRIQPESFFDSKHGIIFERILDLYNRQEAIDVAVVAEELKTAKHLEAVGGYAFLTQVSSRISTTAQASYFIEKVREQSLLREIIRSATSAVENAYNYSGDIEEFLVETKKRIEEIGDAGAGNPIKKISDFQIPEENDPSILLGNRWLNRGDAGILTSTSGMGKSSIQLQQAVLWSLGRDAFGIKPNGKLRSLIIQAEDSDGDIGEVWASIVHKLKLGEAERKEVGERVLVVTDRVNRGSKFIAALRSKIKKHKPDLVWINPLQAFMDGDIKDSKDLGDFLRAGLNSLNEPPTFGYIVIHHTTKPVTSEDNKRQWNEIMYDMAGGADLINWARFINILKPTENEGEFNLVLAKRGRRAEVQKKVEQGAGERYETITSIPLKHCSELLDLPGRKKKMPVIFWEPREVSASQAASERLVKKTEKLHDFSHFASLFPKGKAAAQRIQILYRWANNKRPLSMPQFLRVVDSAVADGLVLVDNSNENDPKYYINL